MTANESITPTEPTRHELDLAGIRARAEAAPPGPWEVGFDEVQTFYGTTSRPVITAPLMECVAWIWDQDQGSAEHIAGMDPVTTLALVDEVERLRAAVVALCGCAPDCAERIACPVVGGVGHFACGWCEVHDQPRHRCPLGSCIVLAGATS